MAKNWNVEMAVKALETDERNELIYDAGKRFPNTVVALLSIEASIASDAGKQSFQKFLGAIPEWVTLRKIESVLKKDFDEEEVEEVKPKKEKKAKKEKEEKVEKKAKKEVVEEDEEGIADEDEDEDEEKPKAKSKKKASTKKSKKVEDEEEDDDDWDL